MTLEGLLESFFASQFMHLAGPKNKLIFTELKMNL
jgi:hypothetical protein